MTDPAPFILAIDVEPGPRHQVSGTPEEWSGFERCVEHLARWRADVHEKTGSPLRITWFLRCDRQVSAYGSDDWALMHFSSLIGQLKSQGDEFGLHFHPYSPSAEGSWQQDWTDEAAILDALLSSVSLYRRRLAELRYFRMGDHWLSGAILNQLEALGIEYDLTIEPGRPAKPVQAPDIGFTPDFTRAPRTPYRPAAGDFLTPDREAKRGIWLVPVTTACFDHPDEPHPVSEGHRVEMLHFAFASSFVQPFIDGVLASGKLTVAVTRSGDLEWSKDMLANFDYLLGHANLHRVVIEPPAAAVQRYQLM